MTPPPMEFYRYAGKNAAGEAVGGKIQAENAIEAKKPGETITVGLLRGNGKGGYEKKTVSVTLGARPNSIPNPTTPEG